MVSRLAGLPANGARCGAGGQGPHQDLMMLRNEIDSTGKGIFHDNSTVTFEVAIYPMLLWHGM